MTIATEVKLPVARTQEEMRRLRRALNQLPEASETGFPIQRYFKTLIAASLESGLTFMELLDLDLQATDREFSPETQTNLRTLNQRTPFRWDERSNLPAEWWLQALGKDACLPFTTGDRLTA